jgi:hypothetical protein
VSLPAPRPEQKLRAMKGGPLLAPAHLQDAQRRPLGDDSTFIDFARSTVFMTEEHVMVDGSR